MNKETKNGQSTVEFALLLPLLLMITVLIIEVSLLFHNFLIITQLSRESARLGALGGTNQQIMDRIETVELRLVRTYFLTGEILDEEISILPENEADRVEGEDISISIPYRVYLNIPHFGEAIGLTMIAASTMRIERI
ncbi:MAG: TadE family protein [bacterium]